MILNSRAYALFDNCVWVDFSRRRARVARLLSFFFKMAAPFTKFEAYFRQFSEEQLLI